LTKYITKYIKRANSAKRLCLQVKLCEHPL